MKQQALSVFLVGKAYSGSTILGKKLNDIDSVFYAGELGRLPELRVKNSYYEYDAECMSCYLAGKECPVFNGKNNSKICVYGPAHAHNTLRKVTHHQIIVDGSKYVDWLNMYSKQNTKEVSTKVILVVKNPISYLHSCHIRGVERLWLEANAWRDTYYDAYRTINRLGLASLVVRNEDYKRDSDKVIQNMINFLGVSSKKHKKPNHAVGGNAGAYQDEFGKRLLKEKYLSYNDTQLAQEKLAINPAIASVSAKLDIITPRKKAQYLQILHDTPMLFDIANMLGYRAKELR